MTQPNASTRRRASASGRKSVAPAPRTFSPELLASVLQATGSHWWEATRVDLELLHRHATEKRPVALFPKVTPPEFGAGEIAPVDRTRVAAFLATLADAALPCAIDCHLATTPEPRRVRLTVVQRSGPARTRRFVGVVTDISPLKKLEDEILAISEREQNRIGQDLHDDLCQVLAGLSCLTRVLENRLAPQLPHEVENLREINQQLVDAMDRTRALTHGLYPAKMRSGDARASLLELAKQVEIRFGLKVRTDFRGRFPAHAAHEILQVYRIAQEAISNAIRHGRATQIDLTLERRKNGMRLSIRDNGTGFPSGAAPAPGIGLQIMRHRADQIGATIRTGNAPRRGALVVLQYQPASSS